MQYEVEMRTTSSVFLEVMNGDLLSFYSSSRILTDSPVSSILVIDTETLLTRIQYHQNQHYLTVEVRIRWSRCVHTDCPCIADDREAVKLTILAELRSLK